MTTYSTSEIVEKFFDVYLLNRRYSEKKFGKYTPERGQMRCILILQDRGILSQKELAEYLLIRSTSAGELIVKLEKKGWVQKTISTRDKRISLISLTKEGEQQALAMKKARGEAHQEILHLLDEDERQAFGKALEKIEQFYIECEAEKI